MGFQDDQPDAAPGKKKRGRPRTVPPDVLMEVWLSVGYVRVKLQSKWGRRPSDSEVCNLIARRGGLMWAMGGDRRVLEQTIEHGARRASKVARYRMAEDGAGRRRLLRDDSGGIFVQHAYQHGPSLRNVYVRANRAVCSNPHVRAAWSNILCDRLGIAREFPPPPRLCRAPFCAP